MTSCRKAGTTDTPKPWLTISGDGLGAGQVEAAAQTRRHLVDVARRDLAAGGAAVEAYPVIAAQQLRRRQARRIGRCDQYEVLSHQPVPLQST